MASPVVTPDIIVDSRVTWGRGGGKCRRVFRVDQLTPSKTIGFDAIVAVMNSNNQARMFDGHPSGAAFYVSDYDVGPCGDDKSPSATSVWVTVIYSTPDLSPVPTLTQISIGGVSGQTLINTWQYGNQKGQPILIGYHPGASDEFDSQIAPSQASDATDNATQGRSYDYAEYASPSNDTVYRLMRLEIGNPGPKSRQYRNTANASQWFGFPKNTVWCRSIDGQNLVGGGQLVSPDAYLTVYEMVYTPRIGGWTRVEFFRDPLTGKIPPGIDITDGTNNGYTLIQEFPLADFNGLNLPNPEGLGV